MKDRQIISVCLDEMKNRRLLTVCLIALTIIAAAVLKGEDRLIQELRPSPLEAAVPQKETVMVQGRVYRVEPKADSQVLYLKDNSIQYHKKIFQESRIIIYINSDLQVNMGNIIRAEGKVSYFQKARNPGNFDQKRFYQIQDIHCQVWAKEARVMDRGVWKWRERLADFRRMWKEALLDELGEEDGATLSAMLLGEKREMDQELRTLYQVNGIGHILAISGLHLSFIGVGMYKVLRRITGSYPVGGAFGILFLMFYILMIGCTVSAVRALTMFLFRVGADMTGRHYDAPTALSVAAVMVLLWRPLSLYDGGFWLSFGAVLAILAVVPVVQEGICTRTLHSNGQKMKMKTKVSVQEALSVYASRSTDVSYSGLVGVTETEQGRLFSFYVFDGGLGACTAGDFAGIDGQCRYQPGHPSDFALLFL